MKRLTTLLLSILFLFASLMPLTASGQKDADPNQKTLAVCLPGSVEFFSVQKKGMDKASAEFGLKLIYSDAEWDAAKQLSQVENFVARGVDAIMLCAADNQALLAAVKLCNDASIPLFTFTNTLGADPNGQVDGIETFIGINEISLGHLMGEMAESLLGEQDANIVLIEGNPGTAPQRMRTEGFMEYVDKHSNWNVVYQQAIPGWTKEGALAAVEAVLQSGEKIDLISCQWYNAAAAAAKAIEESGKTDKIFITGLEFSKELIPMIKDGRVDMTSNYFIEGAGYTVIETASKYFNGETIPSFIPLEAYIVDAENVSSITPEL
jgi:ABC-type sugar transport system substrate-binding protein